VGINDVVGQKRQLPRGIILAPFDRFALHRVELPCYRDKIETPFRAGCREGNVASATEIDPVVFEDLSRPVIVGDDLAVGSVRGEEFPL
jgi:hypothetical protein